MRILLVHAHPCPESFNAALKETTVDSLTRAGHTVTVCDLYADGFNPVMGADERRGYHTPVENEAPVQRYLDLLRSVEGLIFVYPTWWYGPPAILKGWLERVMVPHATFTMPEPNKPIARVLTNIRFLGVVTTMGAPWWWWKFGVREPGRRMLITGLKALFGPACKTRWLALHEMDLASAEKRAQFLEAVRRSLSRIR